MKKFYIKFSDGQGTILTAHTIHQALGLVATTEGNRVVSIEEIPESLLLHIPEEAFKEQGK